MDHGAISESNWLEYLQMYPEFDSNCINNTHHSAGDLTLALARESGRMGFFYECKRVQNILIISKYELQKNSTTLMGVYFIHDNFVFTAKNLKELFYRKCGNIASILGDISDSFANAD